VKVLDPDHGSRMMVQEKALEIPSSDFGKDWAKALSKPCRYHGWDLAMVPCCSLVVIVGMRNHRGSFQVKVTAIVAVQAMKHNALALALALALASLLGKDLAKALGTLAEGKPHGASVVAMALCSGLVVLRVRKCSFSRTADMAAQA
jgi:hypothetical protein